MYVCMCCVLSSQSVNQKKLGKVDAKLKQKQEKRAQKETSSASASKGYVNYRRQSHDGLGIIIISMRG